MTKPKQHFRSACKQNKILTTGFYLGRQKIMPFFHKHVEAGSVITAKPSRNAFQVRIAFVCDEMTWSSFAPLCSSAIYLTPEHWLDTLETFKPDLFFCESAWHGINDCPEAWQGRIFRNHRVFFENRSDLLAILEYCEKHAIPTVFWNKEDPTYFDDQQHDFVDTALRFDYIFTTAEECIPRYEALGHSDVHLMQFGFSPEIFNPLGRKTDATGAVYTGSWFPDHPERCRDMEDIFQWLKDANIPLTIYDRQMRKDGTSSFPEKYRSQVRAGVPYEKMGEIYRQYAYGININTVKDSQTMYARRVLEMMACGLPVISNESGGIRARFGSCVCFPQKGSMPCVDTKAAHELVRDVFLHDTITCRIRDMFLTMGLDTVANMQDVLDVFCVGRKAHALFSKILWPCKQLFNVKNKTHLNDMINECKGNYCIVLNDNSHVPDIRYFMTQFSFLPPGCGVGKLGESYLISKSDILYDTLWPVETIKNGKYKYAQCYCV